MVTNTERMSITSNTNLFMTMATVKEHSLETIFLHSPFHYPRGLEIFFAKRFFHWLVSPLCRSANLSLQSFKSQRYIEDFRFLPGVSDTGGLDYTSEKWSFVSSAGLLHDFVF
jgi:hypothetical protein